MKQGTVQKGGTEPCPALRRARSTSRRVRSSPSTTAALRCQRHRWQGGSGQRTIRFVWCGRDSTSHGVHTPCQATAKRSCTLGETARRTHAQYGLAARPWESSHGPKSASPSPTEHASTRRPRHTRHCEGIAATCMLVHAQHTLTRALQEPVAIAPPSREKAHVLNGRRASPTWLADGISACSRLDEHQHHDKLLQHPTHLDCSHKLHSSNVHSALGIAFFRGCLLLTQTLPRTEGPGQHSAG